ncbi:hypothetical protein COJ85_05685 [Bacillus sp. AFS076308]|uniref:hypothetical protein n=1 Tax=unclassified Bacillus (in: firmicutes) TaxID=185979 RepID=UPI000BF5A8E4|nr:MULTISPECIES: hypothetical protein [unclassified Bacillus (in: firmicutes)]PFO07475.1 hypothetical protein COJ85_05685 [Bacillus sp. AFS076308]PGV47050.1 hypothetical protein COD92_29090 [Bacillus sp. AFS037270]
MTAYQVLKRNRKGTEYIESNGEIISKRCTGCREMKELSHFNKSDKCLAGKSNKCKECLSSYIKQYYKNKPDYHKERYERNKEKITEYRRSRYQKNKDNIKKQSKKFHEKNPDYNKKYYEENKERILERKKKYEEENRERVLKSKREYARRKREEKLSFL